MTHEETRGLLDDYVDGLLPEETRAAVEAHLAGCEGCREAVRGLRSLLDGLASLPESVAPERDLWPEVAGLLDAGKVVAVDFGGAGRRAARFRWAKLAAAAVVLMGLSSALTAFWMGRQAEAPVALAPAPPVAAVPAELRAFEVTYSTTIEELSLALHERREALSPETVRVIERNLAIIDEAIRTSRAALAADPGNRELLRTVTAMYAEKVALLQRAADLPNGS